MSYQCADCGTRENLCTYTKAVLCDPCHEKRVAARIAAFTGSTEYTDEVTCPHCGYVHSDSWEMSDGVYECGDCGREFEIERDVSVKYTTTKLPSAEVTGHHTETNG